MLAWLGYGLLHKPDFKVDVMRDRNIMYRETAHGVENLYQLHLTNATEQTQHYRVHASGLTGLSVESEQTLTAGPTEEVLLPFSLSLPSSEQRGSQRIKIEVREISSGETVSTDSTFYLP
jgi:polyferredoxin